MERCKDYCGVSCVNGSCPVANSESYAEQGCDTVSDCENCFYYKGCEDCAFNKTEMCDHKIQKE